MSARRWGAAALVGLAAAVGVWLGPGGATRVTVGDMQVAQGSPLPGRARAHGPTTPLTTLRHVMMGGG